MMKTIDVLMLAEVAKHYIDRDALDHPLNPAERKLQAWINRTYLALLNQYDNGARTFTTATAQRRNLN